MNLARDTSADGGSVASQASLSFAYTVSGDHRALVVGVKESIAATHITGVTVNGVAMTLAGRDVSIPGGGRVVDLFHLENPPGGSVTIVVQADGVVDFIAAMAASYTSASVTGQPDSVATNNATGATSLTVSDTVVDNRCWNVGVFGNESGLAAAGTGTSQLQSNGTTGLFIGDSNGTVGSGSRSLQATFGSNTTWAGVILSLLPSSDASSGLRAGRSSRQRAGWSVSSPGSFF